jgi:hypothetical protein
MVEKKILDQAMEFASDAAKRAPEYKAETYLGVLVGVLLGQGNNVAVMRQTVPEGAETKFKSALPKQYSAAELFASTKWETEIEKVTVAGFFLERYSGLISYAVNEIRNCLVSAKVMEVPGQGEKHKVWALTQTGERKVEETISEPKASPERTVSQWSIVKS